MNAKRGMLDSFKVRLGREMWADVHTMARFDPSRSMQYIDLIEHQYPCRECRRHFPPHCCNLSHEKPAVFWWFVHNRVNESLGKKTYPLTILLKYNESRYGARWLQLQGSLEERMRSVAAQLDHLHFRRLLRGSIDTI
jgi:hypothetical protein